jgi:hypothetical protein
MSGTAPPRRKVIPENPTMSASRAARGEKIPAVAANENGGMRLLDRKGIDRVAGHAIMLTSQGDLFTLEQAFDEGHCFCQSLDPGASHVEAQTRLFVFGLHVSGA